MARRFTFCDCHAKERGNACGSLDCRTCHPENFGEMGDYLGAICKLCGEMFWRKDSDDIDEICGMCVQQEEEDDALSKPDNP